MGYDDVTTRAKPIFCESVAQNFRKQHIPLPLWSYPCNRGSRDSPRKSQRILGGLGVRGPLRPLVVDHYSIVLLELANLCVRKCGIASPVNLLVGIIWRGGISHTIIVQRGIRCSLQLYTQSILSVGCSIPGVGPNTTTGKDAACCSYCRKCDSLVLWCVSAHLGVNPDTKTKDRVLAPFHPVDPVSGACRIFEPLENPRRKSFCSFYVSMKPTSAPN